MYSVSGIPVSVSRRRIFPEYLRKAIPARTEGWKRAQAVWDCIFAGIHFSFSGWFCASGRSYISFIHNIAAIAFVRIPGVYLMSVRFPDTLFPMGLATAAGSLISVVICVAAFAAIRAKSKKAQHRTIPAEAEKE